MKTIYKIFIITSVIIIAGLFINAINKQGKTTDNANYKAPNTSDYYEIRALKMPSFLSFADEQAPLNDLDVYERIDRELHVNTYWQSNGLLMFKRSHKFFPAIEVILAENGIPDDFKYLALIESGLQNVTSPAGAKGFWQIIKATWVAFSKW